MRARAGAWLAVAALLAAPAAARAAGHWETSVLPVDPAAPSSFSEPGIASGPAGLLVANASTANSGAPATFWLSRDRGANWSVGRVVGDAAIATGDSDVAIAPDGTIYALVLGYGAGTGAQPANPTVLVYRSRDGGTSWAGPATFPPPHGIDQPDRPWLVVPPGHPGRVLMFNSEGGGNVVEWRSADHGATFSGPQLVTGGANSETALMLGSRPLVDPTDGDRLLLLYETAGPPAIASLGTLGVLRNEFPLTQLWLARSDDGGASWASRLVLDAAAAIPGATLGTTLGHLLPAAAVDREGNLYVALSVRRGGDTATRLYLTHSGDHGTTWSVPAPVAAPAASNVMPALAAGAPGRLFLSWYGSDASDFSDPAARWSEFVATSGDGLAARPRFVATRVGSSAPVHVGAIDNAGAIASRAGADWTLRDFQSIVLDDCGRPHVTWAADKPAPQTLTAASVPGGPRPHPGRCGRRR